MGERPLKLFVGNLPYGTSEDSIRRLFSRYGLVQDVWLRNTRVGAPHGYGFVKMLDRRDAEEARAHLDGFRFQGAEIDVHLAKT